MLTKHRDEVFDFSIDFSIWLEAGETIGTPVVTVLRRSGTIWVDVTASFVGTPAPAITGNVLTWRAKAATGVGAASTQPGKGTYAAHHKVTTSLTRILVNIQDLKIDDKATL